MTIEQIGNIGEFVAAIATLATLVYHALQIRQNTRAVQGSMLHGITQTQQTELRWSSDLAGIFATAIEQPADLSTEECWMLNNWFTAALAARQNEFEQFRLGQLDPGVWEASQGVIALIMSMEWGRNWWAVIGRRSFSSAFVAHVDVIQAQEPIDLPLVLRQLKIDT